MQHITEEIDFVNQIKSCQPILVESDGGAPSGVKKLELRLEQMCQYVKAIEKLLGKSTELLQNTTQTLQVEQAWIQSTISVEQQNEASNRGVQAIQSSNKRDNSLVTFTSLEVQAHPKRQKMTEEKATGLPESMSDLDTSYPPEEREVIEAPSDAVTFGYSPSLFLFHSNITNEVGEVGKGVESSRNNLSNH